MMEGVGRKNISRVRNMIVALTTQPSAPAPLFMPDEDRHTCCSSVPGIEPSASMMARTCSQPARFIL